MTMPAPTCADYDLNDKQMKFVEALLIDPNVTRAALKAGYAKVSAHSQGHDLLKHPEVSRALEEGRRARAERVRVEADWVLDRLLDVVEKCMQDVPVLGHDGEPTGEYKFDSAGANRALDMLMKHMGMYAKDNRQRHSPAEDAAAEERVRNRLGPLLDVLRGKAPN